MQCPVCSNTLLVMSERQGIEIDYCPQCRGVWLDRGELDKLIERSASQTEMTEGFDRQIYVTCAIPATSSVAHIRENMGAALGRLPDEAMRRRMIVHVEKL